MDSPANYIVESKNWKAVTLTWDDSAGASFYRIYKGVTNVFANAVLYGCVIQGIQRAIISGLNSETDYYFWIVAEDESGNKSSEIYVQAHTDALPGDFINIEIVKDVIFEWASNNFGEGVIWSKQDGVKPIKPFVELNLLDGGKKTGFTDNFRDGSLLCGNREMVVSVNVYDNVDAMIKANDLKDTLDDPNVIDFFQATNIGISEVRNVVDLSQLLDSASWERRAQFDFTVYFAFNKLIDAGQILTVELTNNLIGGN